MPDCGIDLRQGKGDRPERARIAVQFKAEPVATGEEVEVDDGVRAALGKQRLPCLLYTSPSPRDGLLSRMPSSA